MSKLISTFKIGFDDETKAEIAALKDSLDAVSNRLKAGNIMPTGGLLAANDVPEPDLKQLGQWVFEGLPPHIISLGVNPNGTLIGSDIPLDEWFGYDETYGHQFTDQDYYEILGEGYDTSDCKNSGIEREPVNDVDYLSETVPEIKGMEAREIIIDDLWLDNPAPQITQADMQLIFIKNLSDVLIQRMHSMGRFSEDDYAIGGDKLMPWDILFYESLGYYAVLIDSRTKPEISDLLFFWDTAAATDINWNTASAAFKELRTITEAELPAFRAALEACYV